MISLRSLTEFDEKVERKDGSRQSSPEHSDLQIIIFPKCLMLLASTGFPQLLPLAISSQPFAIGSVSNPNAVIEIQTGISSALKSDGSIGLGPKKSSRHNRILKQASKMGFNRETRRERRLLSVSLNGECTYNSRRKRKTFHP